MLIGIFVLMAQKLEAQTMVFEPMLDASTGLDNPNGWFCQPLTPVTWGTKNILPVKGKFGAVPGLPNSENIFYIENRTEKAFPFPITVPVYDVANDNEGNLYVATETGILKETDQGWQSVFNTDGYIIRIIEWIPERNQFIFSREDHDWMDKARTAMFYTSGDTAIQFYEILAEAVDYDEFQGRGFCSFGIQGAADTDDYLYKVDLATWTEDTEFPEPDYVCFSCSGIGYIVVANDELWIQSGWEYETFVYRDGSWIDTDLGLGVLSVIEDEVFFNSYKVADDFSLSEILIAGDEHSYSTRICKFEDTWYFASRQVTWLAYAPLTVPVDSFWSSLEATCLYSGLARISYPTGIDNLLENEINVYPNPASESITVEGKNVSFYNQYGQLVLTQELYDQTSTLDISNWQPGIYYYSLSKENENVITGKIIVQ